VRARDAGIQIENGKMCRRTLKFSYLQLKLLILPDSSDSLSVLIHRGGAETQSGKNTFERIYRKTTGQRLKRNRFNPFNPV
jgi:hypothetical protein